MDPVASERRRSFVVVDRRLPRIGAPTRTMTEIAVDRKPVHCPFT
jgi:hypothetical protein